MLLSYLGASIDSCCFFSYQLKTDSDFLSTQCYVALLTLDNHFPALSSSVTRWCVFAFCARHRKKVAQTTRPNVISSARRSRDENKTCCSVHHHGADLRFSRLAHSADVRTKNIQHVRTFHIFLALRVRDWILIGKLFLLHNFFFSFGVHSGRPLNWLGCLC